MLRLIIVGTDPVCQGVGCVLVFQFPSWLNAETRHLDG